MLSYNEYGLKQNHSLIFLHGFLGDKSDWDMVISHLLNDFHCLSIDLFGHGKSLVNKKINFDNFSKAFLRFIKSKNLYKFTLIGYSMGGRIAHYLQNHYLQNISCILIGSHLGYTTQQEIEIRKIWVKNTLKKLESESVENFVKLWYSQQLFDLFRKSESFFKIFQKRKNNYKTHLKKALIGFCTTRQKILLPNKHTYFLVGQKDYKYLKYYQEIKCPYSIIRNCSHVIHLENPNKLAMKIKEIINERFKMGIN